MEADNVIALAVSDLHLRETCPPARSDEPDWFGAMGRYIDELTKLHQKYRCPILCAGDVFDRPKVDSKLLNFALSNLPNMIAIPGQHDLPYHDLVKVRDSGFYTLQLCGKVVSDSLEMDGVKYHLFPWGVDVTPCESDGDQINVAVIHSMIWDKANAYPGAPVSSNVKAWVSRLKGYDFAVFGDNHSPFARRLSDGESMNCMMVNCGCLIPMKLNEKSYVPSVWLLCSDGHTNSVIRHRLDDVNALWIDKSFDLKDRENRSSVLSEVMDELRGLVHDGLDFRGAVDRYLNDNRVSSSVRDILLDAMGD